MVVWIPPPPRQGGRVLGADGGEPSVLVRASCAASEVAVSGIGRHEVELPISAGAQGVACELELTPSFYDQLEGSFDRRSAALEALAWIAR